MGARRSPLRATIVKPEQVLPIKPFGLDMKVLLTTEATGGAMKKCSSSSRAPMS